MPTYVYKFVETGETLEIQQSFSDDTLTEAVHPASGTTMAVKKVFTPVGVTFKGGGFYKTDSRSGSGNSSKVNTSGASSDAAAGGTSDSSTATSSDSSGTATASPAATAPTTSTPASSVPASKPATPAASSSS